MEVQLSDHPDELRWKLTRSGVFTVKSMYIDVINSNSIPTSKHVCVVKVPLKIKVFMWFVHKQVILTKDNLIKRNWTGPTRCSFCDRDETIKHLFFDCPLAKVLWQTVHIAFSINPPNSVYALFGTWLNGIEPNLARHIRVGVCALLWTIWTCRNDLVFNRISCIHFFVGHIPNYGTDPFVVATHPDGGQGAFGYWIFPLGDGSSGYLQPVWMAVM